MIRFDLCLFCNKRHIDYGNRQMKNMTVLAQKSSYELLIMILKDMKKFVFDNDDEPTVRDAIVCFCRFGMLATNVPKEIVPIFNGIIKLATELNDLRLIEDFIDSVCHKLWAKHEALLEEVNIEQEEKFKHAC